MNLDRINFVETENEHFLRTSSVREITTIYSYPLDLSSPLLKFFLLDLLNMCHQPWDVHLFYQHSGSKLLHYHFGITPNKLTHTSSIIDNHCRSILDNWVNFKEYSFTLILPCLRFINSCTLASLILMGKNRLRNVSLNLSQSNGPASIPFLSFHYVYTLEQPFQFITDKVHLSTEVTSIMSTITTTKTTFRGIKYWH